MWSESTHKTVAFSATVAFLSFIAGITLWVHDSDVAHTQRIKAYSAACAKHATNPRDVAVCIATAQK